MVSPYFFCQLPRLVAGPIRPAYLPSAPIPPITPIPSHHFSKKSHFFKKNPRNILPVQKKVVPLHSLSEKNSGGFDRNRSLTDWNRTGKTRQRGVFRDAAMNTSSVRQSFRPDKGRYESETPCQDRQKTVPARKGRRRYILTMKSLILAQDER